MEDALLVEIRLISAMCGLFLLYHACMFVCNDSRVCCVCIIVYI